MAGFLTYALILAVSGLVVGRVMDRRKLARLGQRCADLEESEGRMRKLVENTPEGVLELDIESGRIVWANSNAVEVLGRPVAQLVGLRLVDVSPVFQPDGRASCEASDSFIRTVRSGQRPVFEWTVCAADGVDRAALVRMVPLPGEGRIRVSLTDTSDPARTHQSLRESARLRTLVDFATEAIVVVDVETMSFAEVNASAADLFGYSRDQLLEMGPTDLFSPTQPDGRPARILVREAIEQVLASGGLVETEVVARRANREQFHVRVRSIALPGDKPQVRSTIIDVTDEVRKEEILRVAKEEAEKASRTKTVFLAHMSHEIRTPMNGVLGMLELLLDSDLSRDQRQSAELARSSAEALLAILNDVLDISKIEAGQLALECIPFELHKMVNSIVGIVAPEASRNGVEIYCDIQPGVPERAMGDPVRLRQVLSNLVSNAVKFTRDGEVLVRLSVDGRSESGIGIHFSVRDTGAGIAEERLGSIFDPFVQADESITRRFGGTGLGLTICRQLVGLMGGTLEVESELGKGSEFRFLVQLGNAESDPECERGIDLDGLRILLVDDNSTSRRIMAETLESACARVLAAGDVYSALRAARIAVAEEDPFPLAIVDASLPDQGGLQFAQSVRGDRNLTDLKVMMLTPADRPTDLLREMQGAGIDASLPKPVSQADLIDSVRATLGGDAEQGSGDYGSAMSRGAIAGFAGPNPRLSILLAEDNAVNQRVASAILTKRGHQVDVVGNGIAAFEAAMSGRYDVILMDLQMPDLDGIGATERIRGAGCDVRIVALTAHATADDRQRCLAAGMNDFLTKPFQPGDLFAVVEMGRSPSPPSEPGPPPPSEPVDVRGFRAAMEEAGVGDIVDDTLRTYLEASPERLRCLEDAMTSGDTEGVRQAAHALKSSSSAIGAMGLARLLEKAEKAGKAGDLSRCRSHRKEILVLYQSVVDQLERVLAVKR